jgi:hypothetical protein
MKVDNMLKLRDDLEEEGIQFCYSGYMTEDILLSIGTAIKDKLTIDETDKYIVRNVFSIFVEQVQNIIRYSEEMESLESDGNVLELRHGVLAVGHQPGHETGDGIFIAIGNVVKQGDVQRLDNSLSHIQQLDSGELKTLYKQTLKGETPEGSKGAGVGFIDMARKAKRGFEFDFQPINDDRSFFTFTAYV